jgi:hypothetical protein
VKRSEGFIQISDHVSRTVISAIDNRLPPEGNLKHGMKLHVGVNHLKHGVQVSAVVSL